MIQLAKCFDIKEAYTNENFEIFIDFMKWGVVSGNGCWAESYDADMRCNLLWEKCRELKIYDAMENTLNHFYFSPYGYSRGRRSITYSFCSKKSYNDISDIIPEEFYNYAETRLSARLYALEGSDFHERCSKMLKIIEEYFESHGVRCDDIIANRYMHYVANTVR